ncbi:MAG: hypothetical protein KDA89_06515 [Planctomycetaceae bacterium]|nr:hypothetical protein [Planctomycetaceae bacterium]
MTRDKENLPIGHDDGPQDEGSVTFVIRRMQKGDSSSADFLWDRFFERLQKLVKNRLVTRARLLSDEEDLALTSLSELFRGLLNGKFPAIGNRDEFWRLLVTVASRNVIDETARERRQKRGGGRVRTESSLESRKDGGTRYFDAIPAATPAPDVQVMVTERCAELLESLTDPDLQAVAILKTTGATNNEVATALGIGLRTVERRLNDIRSLWSDE